MVVDKEQTKAVANIAIKSIQYEEHEIVEKYQGLKEELERAWK